jgi:hypothetical protein
VFWVISVYFNIRNTLPKFCPFLLGHPVYAKVARGVIRGWTSRKHKEYWQSICGKRQAKGSLERPSAKTVGELFNLHKSQLSMLSQLLKDSGI